MNLKDKKILVITTTDNMIWQFLVPHIEMLKNSGATVDCVCAKTGFFYDDLVNKFGLNVVNINFTRFPFTLKNFKGRKKLLKMCNEKQYDLIYCHQPVGGVMGRMVGKKLKIPVVYVAHGFHFFKGCPIKNKILYKTIEKHYSKYTTSLVTMNEEDFSAAKQMKAKHVYKINGIGVDLEKYKKIKGFDRESFRSSLGIAKDDFVVLSIGELNKNKNTLMLLDSICYLKNKYLEQNKTFNIRYLICGQGKLQKKYENKINRLGLQNEVKLVGFQKEIQKFIQCSDIYIMPSLREGLPKSIMECMVQGLPVVASNIRGCRDLVGENEGGILCKPTSYVEFANAIDSLCTNKDLYKEYSARNLKEIEKYSLENVLAQMGEIFKEV